MHKFSFKRHVLGQKLSKFAIFPDNCPKTQEKMLKYLKIPANPLPLSCQKNVQTTSLHYAIITKSIKKLHFERLRIHFINGLLWP